MPVSAHLSVDHTICQAHWSTSCLGTSGEQLQPQLLAPGILQGPGDQSHPTWLGQASTGCVECLEKEPATNKVTPG